MPTTATAPLSKSITVNAPPERAFEVFTAGIGSWWPLVGHSVGDEAAESVEMEGGVGGRLLERIKGGKTAEWGRVLLWDPPRRVVFSWYPGREGETPMEIDVRFSSLGDQHTRLDLEHRAWEMVSEERLALRPSYETGWARVLSCYAETVEASAQAQPS